jgi:hypothetical protein
MMSKFFRRHRRRMIVRALKRPDAPYDIESGDFMPALVGRGS